MARNNDRVAVRSLASLRSLITFRTHAKEELVPDLPVVPKNIPA